MFSIRYKYIRCLRGEFRQGGVSANRLYGFGQIIVQSFRRDSVDVRGALVEDAVAVDRCSGPRI
jgi:hypothetical protein